MKNIFETNIYYADTDAYGVVWHGAYLRWLEKGRCDFSEALGFNLAELVKQDIALPVANMNEANSPTKTSCLTALSLVQPNFSQMEFDKGSIKARTVLKHPTNKSRDDGPVVLLPDNRIAMLGSL